MAETRASAAETRASAAETRASAAEPALGGGRARRRKLAPRQQKNARSLPNMKQKLSQRYAIFERSSNLRLVGTEMEISHLRDIAEIGRQAAQAYSENTRRPLRTIRRIIKLKAIKRGIKLRIISKDGSLSNWLNRHRPDRFSNLVNEKSALPRDEFVFASEDKNLRLDQLTIHTPEVSYLAHRFVGPSKRVLFIDSDFPDPDRDSGSVDSINYVTWLTSLGYGVHFLSTSYAFDQKLEQPVVNAGAQILRLESEQAVSEFLAHEGHAFEVFFLTRVYCGGRFFEDCRRSNPNAAVVFNTVDLHHVREKREAKLRQDRRSLLRAATVQERELYISRQSDITIVVSSREQEIINAAAPGAHVAVMPLFRKVPAQIDGFERRRGIGFIGGFMHTPNVDAIKYFLNEVWPIIQKLEPSLPFEIAGMGLPDNLRSLPVGVSYKGRVDDLEGWLRKLRLTVAPLRYGAGAKGKVASSIANGVPVVGTELAFEGMGLGPDASDFR